MVMIAAAFLALLIANSPLFSVYDAIVTESVYGFVKDVLMVLFFLLIGLELKREIAVGFLSKPGQLSLPLLSAAGGMLVPALLFLGITIQHPSLWHGWAIPSATDIAFALAILTVVARGISPAIKTFLLAIAIFDDLGAILIIALFYNSSIHWGPLGLVGLGIAALVALNRFKIGSVVPYLSVGIYLWFCLHAAGIHTTIAGVLVGLFIPIVSGKDSAHSPSNALIQKLHPWVGFLILPIFAFTSSGIRLIGLGWAETLTPISIGVGIALFAGKQIGIFGTTLTLVKSGFARQPEGANWVQIYGVSVVAGVGFTVSLFISALAFSNELQGQVKIGVIGGSLMSVIWGAAVFWMARRQVKP